MLTSLKSFCFLCPQERVGEVLEVLGFEGVKVFPFQDTTFQVSLGEEGELQVEKRTEIRGTCRSEVMQLVITTLAGRKIAGHSLEAPILFRQLHSSYDLKLFA